jgi:hypothetical protein
MIDYTGQQSVAKFRERLAVNKQRSHRFHIQRLNLKTLNKVEGKEQYHVVVSNRFAAWEDFVAEVDINSASETVRENTLEWFDDQRARRACVSRTVCTKSTSSRPVLGPTQPLIQLMPRARFQGIKWPAKG